MAEEQHNHRSNGTGPSEDAAHDVLAAEEFAVGAGDPALHPDPVHDVLAAEEFAVGSGDPALNHGPVELPGDPTGITEPHDVLAAEEFALPAAPPARGDAAEAPSRGRRTVLGAATLAAGAAVFSVLRRRGRRSRLDRVRDRLS